MAHRWRHSAFIPIPSNRIAGTAACQARPNSKSCPISARLKRARWLMSWCRFLLRTSATSAPKSPLAIDATLKVFEDWLLLKDHTPVLAVLGAIGANYLPGDPVWLALIAPPSSAKTEILNATAGLPHVVRAATVTPAGLLS